MKHRNPFVFILYMAVFAQFELGSHQRVFMAHKASNIYLLTIVLEIDIACVTERQLVGQFESQVSQEVQQYKPKWGKKRKQWGYCWHSQEAEWIEETVRLVCRV